LRLPYAEVTASGFLFADRQLNSDVTHPSAAAEVHMPVVASGPLQMNPQAELQNSGHSGNLQALRLGIDSIVGYHPNYSQQSSICWVTPSQCSLASGHWRKSDPSIA